MIQRHYDSFLRLQLTVFKLSSSSNLNIILTKSYDRSLNNPWSWENITKLSFSSLWYARSWVFFNLWFALWLISEGSSTNRVVTQDGDVEIWFWTLKSVVITSVFCTGTLHHWMNNSFGCWWYSLHHKRNFLSSDSQPRFCGKGSWGSGSKSLLQTMACHGAACVGRKAPDLSEMDGKGLVAT